MVKYSSMDSHHLLNLVNDPSNVSGAFTGRRFPQSSSFPSFILLRMYAPSIMISVNSSLSSCLGSLDCEWEGFLETRLLGQPLCLHSDGGGSSSSSLGSSSRSTPVAISGCLGGGGGGILPASLFRFRNSSLSLCAWRNSSSSKKRAANVDLLFLIGTWASHSVTISAVVLMDLALATLRLVAVNPGLID